MVFCSECGTKFEGKFCPECGTKAAEGGVAAAPAAKPALAAAPKPSAVASSSGASRGKTGDMLSAHEDWIVFDNQVKEVSRGNGIPALKAALPDDNCGFAYFRLYANNVGNVGKDIMTEANIVLQWKGPSAKMMAKVKNNGALQTALDTCTANKGFLEVLGKVNLDVATIYDCWRPGSGSKVIQD